MGADPRRVLELQRRILADAEQAGIRHTADYEYVPKVRARGSSAHTA